jgi:peroxiredoxin
MNIEMKIIFRIFLSFAFTILLFHCAASVPDKPPGSAKTAFTASEEKDSFPVLELPIPKEEQEKGYLGLSGNGKFRSTQIKTKILVIEIFSMYCPYCQKQAPILNELYHAIMENAHLKDNIKIIGIGSNNTPYEVNLFKKKYKVPFPLFPDKNRSIVGSIGGYATPTIFGIQVNEDGTHRKLYAKTGVIEDASQFLAKILKLTELEEEH